jgi:hypothetical protein
MENEAEKKILSIQELPTKGLEKGIMSHDLYRVRD